MHTWRRYLSAAIRHTVLIKHEYTPDDTTLKKTTDKNNYQEEAIFILGPHESTVCQTEVIILVWSMYFAAYYWMESSTIPSNVMLRLDEIKSEEPTLFPGCDICGDGHETDACPQLLQGTQIENARAPSRAKLTLPANLRIKTLKNGTSTIVARENIACGTRFGPFESQVVYDAIPQTPFPLKIFEKNGGSYYLDSSNEEECNWMCLVNVAKRREEQNLMAYQLQQDIYFAALRDVRIHEELVVWYAPHYGKKMGITPPWPIDHPEQLDDFTLPQPEKGLSNVSRIKAASIAEKNAEPAVNKRKRRKKIFKDFVEIPDFDGEHSSNGDDDAKVTRTEDSERPVDQREWHCSQCGQVYQNCTQFARHLREHYHPRKTREQPKKSQKNAGQVRPKKFNCDFCQAKFNSKKLLQRHRLRLHRLQIRGTKTNTLVAEQQSECNKDVSKTADLTLGSTSKRKPCHISDTDAASILLEIEGKCDIQDEPNGSGAPQTSMDIISVESDASVINSFRSSDVGGSIANLADANSNSVDESAAPDISEESSLGGGDILEEVVVNAQEDSMGEMMASLLTDLIPNAKNSTPFSCDICNRPFEKSDQLFRHIRVHTHDFSCNRCCKVFTHKESLLNHTCSKASGLNPVKNCDSNREDEDDEGQSTEAHSCPFCQKTFAKKQFLQQHISKHTGAFTCEECGKSYCSKDILKNHVCSNSTEKGTYSCKICHKTFSKQKYLEKHIPVHTGAHSCPNCGKWLRSNDSLINHMRICWQVKKLESDGATTCSHCNQEFTDSRSFRRHMYDHTHLFACQNCGARFRNKASEMKHLCSAQCKVSCNFCGQEFTNVASLSTHKLSHAEAEVECTMCGVTCGNKEELCSHECKGMSKKKGKKRRAQPSLQPLICEVCGSLFSSTSSLNVHKRLHGAKQFSCDICGKRFHRKDLMLDHCAVHGAPAIPCVICHKMFKTKKSLDVHFLIHDGVKRFTCSTCGKEFYQKGNLLKHEEVHNPDRKYACSFCSKSFSTKEYLAIHVLEHTRGRIHACNICDKSFVKEHQLKAHIRVFHTNMAYVCTFCGLSVKLKHSLKRHLNKKHPDQRSLWNNNEQIEAMLVPHAEADEEEGEQIENLTLVENLNQTQDGTEVLLAVAGIGSEALQQAIASGAARIQQGSTPNTIEISLPVDQGTHDAFMTDILEDGETLQTRIIHLPLTNEMEEVSTATRVEVESEAIDQQTEMAVHTNLDDDMETQITVLDADNQFQSSTLTEDGTIMLENGTILQQGVSQDGSDVLFYVLTTEEESLNTS